MVGDVEVVMDGVDRDRPKRRPNPPWIWVMAGLVVGFGFGALLSTPVTTTPVPVDDRTPQEPVSAVEEIPDPVGIADAVPGFPDALVAVSESEGSTLEYLLWPVAGDPIARGHCQQVTSAQQRSIVQEHGSLSQPRYLTPQEWFYRLGDHFLSNPSRRV